MLVLSRKEGQDIVIGDDIVIRVLGIFGNRVQIGIIAPRDVRVLRQELIPKTGGSMVSIEPIDSDGQPLADAEDPADAADDRVA